MPFSLMFGKPYEHLNNCPGWCRLPKARRVAMCVMCDKSNEFGMVIRNNEEGEGVLPAAIPIERGRSVVYHEGSKHLKATGHLLVACCYEIGSYLIEMRRRQPANRITDGEWRTTWDKLKKCNGRAVGNMCNPQPKYDRGFEVSMIWWNCIYYHNKQVTAGVVKAANCVMLSQLDFKS